MTAETWPARRLPAARAWAGRMVWRSLRLVLWGVIAWLMAAYVILPLGWRWKARHHPGLADAPRVTRTRDGIPGDPINLALIATEDQLVSAMLRAGWFPADPITLRSCLRIAAGTLLRRPYDTAPVSDLFLWDRKQDLAFQQSIGNDPRRRHHVRFWRSDQTDEDGRPLWAGAATLDTSVGLSRTTGKITHHIDADVDAERNKLLEDLARAGALGQIEWIGGFHERLQGRNGGGDPWHTDGMLPVAALGPIGLNGADDRRAGP